MICIRAKSSAAFLLLSLLDFSVHLFGQDFTASYYGPSQLLAVFRCSFDLSHPSRVYIASLTLRIRMVTSSTPTSFPTTCFAIREFTWAETVTITQCLGGCIYLGQPSAYVRLYIPREEGCESWGKGYLKEQLEETKINFPLLHIVLKEYKILREFDS